MRRERVNTLVVRTPEGVSFPLTLAGPLSRFFAFAIDLACIIVIQAVLSYVLAILGFLSVDFLFAALTIMYFAISIGYGIVLEWFWRGQTLGKRLLRLRVVDSHGLRLQFSQVVVRNLLRFVDSLPVFYLVGGTACLLSSRAQRLGDYAANTVVIRNVPAREYDLQAIKSDKYNSFRDYPHLEARLRQRVSAQEATLALQALVRREDLDPQARVQLFEDLAAHFRSLVTFPQDATVGLTEEQYVRNIVESVFRTPGAEQSPAA